MLESIIVEGEAVDTTVATSNTFPFINMFSEPVSISIPPDVSNVQLAIVSCDSPALTSIDPPGKLSKRQPNILLPVLAVNETPIPLPPPSNLQLMSFNPDVPPPLVATNI